MIKAQIGEPGFATEDRRFTLTLPTTYPRGEAIADWHDKVREMGYAVVWGPTIDEVMLESFHCWGMVKPA